MQGVGVGDGFCGGALWTGGEAGSLGVGLALELGLYCQHFSFVLGGKQCGIQVGDCWELRMWLGCRCNKTTTSTIDTMWFDLFDASIHWGGW